MEFHFGNDLDIEIQKLIHFKVEITSRINRPILTFPNCFRLSSHQEVELLLFDFQRTFKNIFRATI